MLNDWSHKAQAILIILPSLSQSAWNTRFYFGHQKPCMDNNTLNFDHFIVTWFILVIGWITRLQWYDKSWSLSLLGFSVTFKHLRSFCLLVAVVLRLMCCYTGMLLFLLICPVKPTTNECQKMLNKCETRNKTVFHTRLRHPEMINSVPLNSVLQIKQIGV